MAAFCNSNSKSSVAHVHAKTLQLHGPQPARLLCPWDSPGKSIGVGGYAPVFLSAESHGQRRLAGCNPWGSWMEPPSPALQADSLPSEPQEKPHFLEGVVYKDLNPSTPGKSWPARSANPHPSGAHGGRKWALLCRPSARNRSSVLWVRTDVRLQLWLVL